MSARFFFSHQPPRAPHSDNTADELERQLRQPDDDGTVSIGRPSRMPTLPSLPLVIEHFTATWQRPPSCNSESASRQKASSLFSSRRSIGPAGHDRTCMCGTMFQGASGGDNDNDQGAFGFGGGGGGGDRRHQTVVILLLSGAGFGNRTSEVARAVSAA
jgi:hypothetical protein